VRKTIDCKEASESRKQRDTTYSQAGTAAARSGKYKYKLNPSSNN